jgi:hypothetical protein
MDEDMGVAMDQAEVSRIDLARAVNKRVLFMGAEFDQILDPDEPREALDLMCECGCLRWVRATPEDYAAQGGAWLDGHRPTEPVAA